MLSPGRLTKLLAMSASLALVPSTSGWAATATLFDPRGDAPASADVLRYRITNGAAAVHVAVKVRNLARQSDITLSVDQAGPGRYLVRTGPVGKGTFTFARHGTEHAVKCAWTLVRRTGARSTLKIGVPQSCFGSRAGGAWVDFTMWQAGGQGSDDVTNAFVPRG